MNGWHHANAGKGIDEMRDLIRVAVYYLLSVLLFPVMLIGYVIWVGRSQTGRGSGVSGTAQGPLSARCSSTSWAPGKMSRRIG